MPQFGVIYFENAGRSAAMAQSKFAQLDGRGRSYRQYEGTSKPSLPDYCAYTSGGYTFSQGHFGGNPAGVDSATTGGSGVANILNQIQAAGFTWKAYEEGVTSAGYTHAWGSGLGTNHYATRHCPAAFYANTYKVIGANHGTGRYDFDELAYDIAHASLPDFFLITPNLNNDGHDQPLSVSNAWLLGQNAGFAGVDALIAAMRSNGLLHVTFDNVPAVDTTAPITGTGIVYSVVVGPGVGASVDSTALHHMGMLSAIQGLFGLPKFTGAVDSHYTGATAVPLPGSGGGGGGGDTTPPTTPTVALAVQSSSSVAVTLSGSTDNVAVTGYEISRSLAGAGAWTVIAASAASPFTDTGLAASTAYDYRARARDAAGNFSAYSTTQTATTSAASGGAQLSTSPAANTPGFVSSAFNFSTNIDAGRMWKTAVRNGVVYIVGESDHTIDHSGGGSTDRTNTPYITAVNASTGAVIQTYAPAPNDVVRGCRLTSDGKLVVWGNFTTIAGVTRKGFAILNTLSGPTDSTAAAVDASSPDLNITGGIVTRCILQDASNRGWLVGAFTSAGGSTHNRVCRLIRTGGVWSVDQTFTASIASGTAKGLHALSDGSKIFVGGDMPNAIVAFDGATGASARFDFSFPGESGAHHCLWITGDDSFVYFGGDFGPNMAICTDTNGSGPTHFTNVTTGGTGYNAYWYAECDGNVQAGQLIVMGGVQYILLGHHGDFCMPTKNVAYSTTGNVISHGIMCWRAGNVTNDGPVFLHPPDFGADASNGSPLKLWGAYQDSGGALHVNGDFTTVNGNNAFYRYARFDPAGGAVDTTPPTTPGGLTLVVAGSTEIDLAWTASTDAGGSGLAGYQVWRDDGSGAGFQLLRTVGVVTSYHDTGLAPGTFYQYHLIAFDGAGNTSAPGQNHGATTTNTGGGGAGVAIDDLFNRNVSNGWGTSGDGHPWTQVQGVASQLSVVNGTGAELQQVAGNAPIIYLEDINQQDYDVTCTYKFSALPTGGTQNITLAVRGQDPQNYTRLTISQSVGGHAQLGIDRQIANVNNSLGSFDTGAGQAAGTLYKARLQAIGTAVRGKVWLASAAEPSTWQIDAVDNVAPVISGFPGLRFQATSGWTGGAVYTVTEFKGSVPGSTGGGGGGTGTGAVTVPADGSRYLGIEANPRNGRSNAQEQSYVDGQIAPDYQVIRRYHGWTRQLIDSYEASITDGRIIWPYWFITNATNTYTTYAAILNGSQDSVINANIAAVKAYGLPMFLTWQMEPENDTATAGSAANFILAYRYIVDKFRAANVTNVSWVLVLMGSTYDAGTADTWYPGDTYVDWIGCDAYNWYNQGGHSAPYESFSTVFNAFLSYANGKGKPAAIGEMGTVDGPSGVSDKAGWYDGALTSLRTATWNRVKCVCYFNSQPFSGSPNWWLDDDPSGTSPTATLVTHWATLAADAMWISQASTGGGGGGGGGGGTPPTILTDDSGHGMDGKLFAGSSGVMPSGVAGPFASRGTGPTRALHFDGTGGRVEIPDTLGSLNAIHWTLACWVKLDNPPGDTDPAHQRYEGMEKAGAYWVNVRYDTTPPYVVRTGSFFGGLQQGFDFIDSAAAIPLGTWKHIAGTYDGANLRVWIDGVQSASKARTGDSGGGTTEPLTIGAKHRYGAPGELLEAFMHGAITGAVVLPFAATATQIQQLMATDWPIWSDTSQSFTPGDVDVGQILRAKQVATNRVGTAVATGPPSAAITASANASAPVNVTAPALSDTTPQEGQVITANQGQWTGTPPPSVSDTIQISSSPNGPWTNAAAPNQAYTIPTDGSAVGMYLRVNEVASNSGGTKTKASPVSAAVLAGGTTGLPTNTTRPRLSPTTVSPGVTLTATEGTWQNLVTGDAALYRFEGRSGTGAAITTLAADSTANTYTVQPGDAQIRVAVTHHARDGTPITAFSDWILPVGDWTIQPIFPQEGTTVRSALVSTSWQLTGQLPIGEAFYVRGDGGPWIPADVTGGGILSADVTLIGGDGVHLIEGDVH